MSSLEMSTLPHLLVANLSSENVVPLRVVSKHGVDELAVAMKLYSALEAALYRIVKEPKPQE